jgi:uncharacterized protein YndB with AHSA1/START domain
MKNEAFKIEQTYPAPISAVWTAITDKHEMKKWYFDLPEFEPKVGCAFQFWGGPAEDRQYKHLCKVIEVIPLKKIAYSWQYEGYAGYTVVTFELFDENSDTRLLLTHEGLESFPPEEPDFARQNFVEGWSWIIGTLLKEYLQNKV